jgi:hypothetical protein
MFIGEPACPCPSRGQSINIRAFDTLIQSQSGGLDCVGLKWLDPLGVVQVERLLWLMCVGDNRDPARD